MKRQPMKPLMNDYVSELSPPSSHAATVIIIRGGYSVVVTVPISYFFTSYYEVSIPI